MVKIRQTHEYRSRQEEYSYCRGCGENTLVIKAYPFGSSMRRVAFCTKKGCGYKLEVDGYDTENALQSHQ